MRRRTASTSYRHSYNPIERLEGRRLLAAALSGMDLVDANTDLDISPLVNGTVVDLSTSDKKISVQANVAAGATVGSVQWALDGVVFRSENSQPFCAANDVSGDLLPWNVSAGQHTLTVTPFNGANRTGGSGPAINATFTVVGPSSPPPPTAPTLSINDVSTNEGNSGTKLLTFTVTRTGSTTGTSRVNWATQNSTAGEGDYQVASGSITFAAGQTTRTISITIKGDTKVESNEVFRVNLSSPTGAAIADGQGNGTIVNDDTTPTDPNDPTASVPRELQRHQEFLNRIQQGPIGLLFIGDSITDWFDSTGASVYNANYSQYQPANFGVSGDKTQNVIWRITNGELDGIDPDVVVLQIGTNNLSSATDSKIADGIKKIVGIIRQKLPETKILLLGIFPRGSATDARRARIQNINNMIDDVDDGGQHVKFLDIGNKFLNSSGNIPTDVMSDGLHPTAKGYQIWADAMRPTLLSLLD
jgi:lysophospholipase L1-like esterase